MVKIFNSIVFVSTQEKSRGMKFAKDIHLYLIDCQHGYNGD